tara:strand:- start:4320 stop:4508 length:189 start_codon:yes stop_codon:yes gene_type:complete
MYIVSYGSVSGYHEQAFPTYEDATKFVSDYEDEFNGMDIECVDDDDGSSLYWSDEMRDYIVK